jgi:hypothetical protein
MHFFISVDNQQMSQIARHHEAAQNPHRRFSCFEEAIRGLATSSTAHKTARNQVCNDRQQSVLSILRG